MAVTVNMLSMVALTGLMGAPHCLIMCGGISSSYAMNARQSPLKTVLAYHAGRITTYTAIGCFMGAIGSFINVAARFVGIQGLASIVGGALILLWTFRRYTLPIHRLQLPGSRYLQEAAARFRLRLELTAVYLTGLMLGFIPCGLTYAMQMNAAASASWLEGLVIMLVFGISTVPILLLTALSTVKVGKKWRKRMRQIGLGLAVIMGVLSLMKGFSANGWIPPIHPWLW